MINELSADYIKAKELDRRIKTSAQLAQQSLYDMCMSFKEMRDSKLYKELGYSDFGDYCEKETGFKRTQVYSYIAVCEKLPIDFVRSSGQIGIKKLTLLTQLSEEDRTEITETTNLENTTVKELKEKIRQMEEDKNSSDMKLDEANRENIRITRQRNELSDKISELEQQIKDLESRPIDVAVVDHGDENRLLKETIKSLERENIKQNEALSEQYQKDVREVRENLENEKRQALEQAEKDKQKKLEELRSELVKTKAEYEKKLAEKPSADERKTKFKIYLTAAYDSLKRLTEFAKSCGEKVYADKVIELVSSVKNDLEG